MAHSSAIADHPQMQMLYDSDTFVVVRLFAEHDTERIDAQPLPREGFEIVDKQSGKEVYLDGAWAAFFQQELDTWGQDSTSPEDIEATLERYAQLAQNPVLLH